MTKSSALPLDTAPGTFACSGQPRGDARPESDLDLLVEMEADRSLLDLVGLGQELEALVQRKVDVLTEASFHPALREQIINEARAL